MAVWQMSYHWMACAGRQCHKYLLPSHTISTVQNTATFPRRLNSTVTLPKLLSYDCGYDTILYQFVRLVHVNYVSIPIFAQSWVHWLEQYTKAVKTRAKTMKVHLCCCARLGMITVCLCYIHLSFDHFMKFSKCIGIISDRMNEPMLKNDS